MIVVYTREGCAYCPGVKRYLKELLKVDFEERDGDPGDSVYMGFANKFGGAVPLVVNTDTDEGVTGNGYGRIKEIVGRV